MIKNKIDNPPNRPIINILKLNLEDKNIEEEFDLEISDEETIPAIPHISYSLLGKL